MQYAAHQAVGPIIDSHGLHPAGGGVGAEDAFRSLGYEARTVKGGVLIDLGGSDENDGPAAGGPCRHPGGMVAGDQGNGRLQLTALGGCVRKTARRRTSESIPVAGGCIGGNLPAVQRLRPVNGQYGDTKAHLRHLRGGAGRT